MPELALAGTMAWPNAVLVPVFVVPAPQATTPPVERSARPWKPPAATLVKSVIAPSVLCGAARPEVLLPQPMMVPSARIATE